MAEEVEDTILTSVCMYCGKVTGTKPGYGVSGESATICPECWAEKFPGVPYPIEPDVITGEEVSTKIVRTMLTKTINDITVDQMNRIVRTISRMPRADRDIPVKVADVIAAELGPQKALQYVDKALAAGQISVRDYDQMRAALIMPIPRQEIPEPAVRRMAQDLVETQRRLNEDFKRLTGAGQQAFRKPFEAVSKDVQRIRRSWGIR